MSTEKKIIDALSLSVCGGWDRGFLESILNQLTKKRPLSLKQKQTLGKVLARNTPESQRDHENWQKIYATEYQHYAKILAVYHARQPYYKAMANDILDGKVPERTKFLRMHDNKYSKKVLGQYDTAPKYGVGDYLKPRASLESYKHVEFEHDTLWTQQNRMVQNFKKRGGFVLCVLPEIHSAAKGAKRYKLLPVGETTPIIVEERFLKRGHKR